MVTPPGFIKKIFSNNFIFEIPEQDKNIYLTIDDGPTPEISDFIVEELNKYNAEATFFCVGENILNYPQSFQLYLKNNYSIGNHTFNHLNGWKTKDDVYFENVEKFSEVYKTNLFRPPYGKIRLSQVARLKEKYKIYLWSIISRDFDKDLSKEKCLNNVIKNVQQGSIVVFHDNIKASKNLFYALPRMLDYYTEKGYSFKKL